MSVGPTEDKIDRSLEIVIIITAVTTIIIITRTGAVKETPVAEVKDNDFMTN